LAFGILLVICIPFFTCLACTYRGQAGGDRGFTRNARRN